MYTNLKETASPRVPLSPWHKFAIFVAFWAALFLGVALLSRGFAAGPSDVPAGFSWVNADASGPTFCILRGGPRLILELDRHSQLFYLGLMTFGLLSVGYGCWLGLQGKLRYRYKRGRTAEMSRKAQYFSVAVGVLVLVYIVWSIGVILRGQTLDLDPAHDAVVLDGQTIARFQDLQQFQAYTTHARFGEYAHIRMYLRGQTIKLGGPMPRWDVQSLAPYLNRYLADVRGASGASTK